MNNSMIGNKYTEYGTRGFSTQPSFPHAFSGNPVFLLWISAWACA